MIVRFTADVDGLVQDSSDKVFECNGFDAKLIFEQGLLSRVSIERELTSEEIDNLDNKIEEAQPNSPGVITLGVSQEIRDNAYSTLQTIESLFGLHNIKKLYWRDATMELIPQNKNEDEIEVRKIDLEKSRSETPHVWNFDLENFDWDLIEDLKVPLAFFRKGMRFLDEFDYINSYTNFYFILEGFYSEGEHTNIESVYLENDELMRAAKTGFNTSMESLGGGLEPFFDFYDKDQCPEGYIKLLVTVRHQLNHFSINIVVHIPLLHSIKKIMSLFVSRSCT